MRNGFHSPLKIASRSWFAAALTMSVLLLTSCASPPKPVSDPCHKRRGAIDIGSGSTKGFAAVVDICQTPARIVERLFDEKSKISFGESVERSSENTFSPDVVTDASAKIATMAEEMNAKNIERLTIVATAAFRKAKNGAETAAKISDEVTKRLKGNTTLDLQAARVQILSQDAEAEIGALSAITNLPHDVRAAPSESSDAVFVVWDIGGGSMQMFANGKKGEATQHHLYTGDLASVTFKNQVLRELKKKDPSTVKSPNPLGKDRIKAVSIARAHAKKNVPEIFKKSGNQATWIGIGGVLAISVAKQVEKEGLSPNSSFFTDSALAKTLEARANRKDEEIESEYRETEITNLALVLGYMQELGIKRVETVEASLTQGLVTR